MKYKTNDAEEEKEEGKKLAQRKKFKLKQTKSSKWLIMIAKINGNGKNEWNDEMAT